MNLFPASRALTLEAAFRDIDAKKVELRLAAADVLGDVRDPDVIEKAAQSLCGALGDLRPEMRTTAALALGDMGQGLAVEHLVATLDDQVAEVRQAAAMALGKLGLIEGFAALQRSLTEGTPDLRFQAATSLVEIDADKAYPILIAALDDEGDGEVIGAIALALGAVGNRDAVARLRPKLDGIAQQGRFDIAYAFAQLGADEAVELLAPFADDKQYGWDALSALELVGDSKAAEIAAKVITSGRAIPIVELRATQCVLKSDANDGQRTSARRALVGGLRHKKHEEKALAVELLGELGGAWAKAPLEQFASKWAGRKLREEALEALAQIASRESS